MLEFTYTVTRDDADTDGVSLCSDTMADPACGAISFNCGSIVAQSDGDVPTLALPALGNQSGHKVDGSAGARTVAITSSPANRTEGYLAGETIRVRVSFSEDVTVTGSPYVLVRVGNAARRATYESGSGTRGLIFTHEVVRGDVDANGVSLCSDTTIDTGCGRIALDGGAIAAESDGAAAKLVRRRPRGGVRGEARHALPLRRTDWGAAREREARTWCAVGAGTAINQR